MFTTNSELARDRPVCTSCGNELDCDIVGTSDLAQDRPVRISCGIELDCGIVGTSDLARDSPVSTTCDYRAEELLHTMTVEPPSLLCADMKREKDVVSSTQLE